ncbi:class I SAM-dependent methyltransferase [Cryobacterium algoritolerans]|uniref:class I SAM-dependent methyltransferase n=1 Tax=Cryobacterium algoritolerans TaxID=1259184 RepID=UPI001F5438F3|nr:class I SAM-dependent methyltransferase [Cryobacterium algoritolerans]
MDAVPMDAVPMDWPAYYDAQAGRSVRFVLRETLRLRGETPAGNAIDLGCGEGTETRHLLRAGWRVLAFDADSRAETLVRRGLDATELRRLAFRQARFEDLPVLPPVDLVYAGFALPFCDPAAFPGVWAGIRAALTPGAWFAGEFFGPHDDWAGRAEMNFHDRAEVESLLDGLAVQSLVEDDRPGQSAMGPKHWHVFHVIARNPPAPA